MNCQRHTMRREPYVWVLRDTIYYRKIIVINIHLFLFTYSLGRDIRRVLFGRLLFEGSSASARSNQYLFWCIGFAKGPRFQLAKIDEKMQSANRRIKIHCNILMFHRRSDGFHWTSFVYLQAQRLNLSRL